MRTKQLWIIGWVLLLAACAPWTSLTETATVEPLNVQKPKPSEQATGPLELEIWSMGYLEDIIASYAKENGITIQHRTITKEQINEVLDALANGEGPDLLSLESSYLGQFSHLSVMQDLREPEFNLDYVKKAFPGLNLERYMSLDGTRLYAVPRDIQGAMTFYRADILREHGFPDEPEELGRFLEDPQNWLWMATELKKHNISMVQWPFEPMEIISMGELFYDRQGNYIRSSPKYAEVFAVAQEVERSGLALNKSIWDPVGQEALRRGELATIYLGEWAQATLKEWAPDTAHLWRMTRLPFNSYGTNGGTVFMIPEQSQNKVAAWKFIEYVMQIDKYYRESMAIYQTYDKLPVSVPLPFDDQMQQLWKAETEPLIYDHNVLPMDSLRKTQASIENQFPVELRILREVFELTSEQ